MENSNLLPMRWGQGSENNIEDKIDFLTSKFTSHPSTLKIKENLT